MVGVRGVGVSKCVMTKHHLILCKRLIVKEVLTRRRAGRRHGGRDDSVKRSVYIYKWLYSNSML